MRNTLSSFGLACGIGGILLATPSLAAQTLSAIGFTPVGSLDSEALLETLETGGQILSVSNANSSGRVQTGIGTNKVELTMGGGGSDQYATSIWSETFTVDPTASGPVSLSFKVRVDGSTSASLLGYSDDPDFLEPVDLNYFLRAYRGPAGTFYTGESYGDLQFRQEYSVGAAITPGAPATPAADIIRYFDIDEGLGGYAQSIDENGTIIFSDITQGLDGPVFSSTVILTSGAVLSFTYYPDRLEAFNNGIAQPIIYYSENASFAQAYESAVANSPVIATRLLCGDFETGCGSFPGGIDQELALSFTLNPGEQFSLVGALMIEDLAYGSIDFFNTAQLTEITSTAGLLSESGVLTLARAGSLNYDAANGGFSFRAAVPEPATWAMMLVGFGLAGGAIRLRRNASAVFA